ncbi:MAG: efflux RND transporter periplasmic adaptor subunit [Macellibacteroides fermentans]|uniref:efflux RND transporter periplasmic adaptor subunit n=1 Tax=Macellibacteroides fermentans TaxID=879969 RepID=UPI003ACA7E8C
MKHTILCVLAILTACNSSSDTKQEMPTSVTADSVTVISPDSTAYSQPYDSTSIDGTTAATSINKVSFNGTLIIPPQNFASVTMLMGGIIRPTNLLPGSYVKKGTLLATLDNLDFISLQQTFLESHAQTEYLKSEYNRQLVLSKEEVASVKKLEQSKADYLSMKSKMAAAAAQLSLLGISTQSLLKNGITPALEIKAPVNGYIGKVKVNVGKYLNEGDILCEIINKQETLLRLTTYEKDLKDIRLGAKVWFRVNGMGTKTFEAKLISIGQEVDETSRSLEVFAKVISEDPTFRPGMYVTAQIEKNEM